VSEGSIRRTVTEELQENQDLFRAIADVGRKYGIMSGRVTGAGTVRRAVLTSYDQKSMTKSAIRIDRPMEVLSLYGHLSAENGELIPHVHVVLSDSLGNGSGGHLLPDSAPVSAFEVTIEEFESPGEHQPRGTL